MADRTIKQDGTAQYTTLQEAALAADPYDTLLIQDSGTYTGRLNLTSYISGGWTKILNIHADTGCTPTWDGASAGAVPALDVSTFAQDVYNSSLTIKGIRFVNWNADAGAGSGVVWVAGRHAVQFERCTFQDCAGTILNYARGTAGTPSLFDRCTVRDCGPLFFSIESSAARHVRIENLDTRPRAGVPAIEAYYAECVAYHVTASVRMNNARGIVAGTARNVIVRNEAGYGGTDGILVTTLVSHALVHGTWAAAYNGTQGDNCLTGDPLFVDSDAQDYHLQDGSPALNTGVDVGVTSDRDGNARPAGAGPDMGAYEKIASVTGAECTDPTTVRVTFSGAVSVTEELGSPASYALAQVAPASGVVPVVSAVAPEDGEAPTYVDLTTSEHTAGQGYRVTLLNVPGVAGTATYTGEGMAPTVAGVDVLAPDLVRVRFSEPMALDGALTSPGSYGFLRADGELDVPYVVAVTPEPGGAPTYVDLTIGGGRRDAWYTLRVKA